MPPKHVSPMHRTISLDYGFVIAGELEVSPIRFGNFHMSKPRVDRDMHAPASLSFRTVRALFASKEMLSSSEERTISGSMPRKPSGLVSLAVLFCRLPGHRVES